MLSGIYRTIRSRGIIPTCQIAFNTLRWRIARWRGQRLRAIRIHGFQMLVDMSDMGLSRELFIWRDREKALRVILRQVIRPGMRVLDVGGNLGYYPLLEAQLVGEHGEVHVLEPYPPNFEILQKNVKLNAVEHRVRVQMLAAAEKNGECEFHVSKASNLGTLVKPQQGAEGLGLTGEVLRVQAVCLSDLVTSLGAVDLVRMDPEGAEVGIMKGLLRAIDTGCFSGRIITEIHSDRYTAANNIVPVIEALCARGYRAEFVTSCDERASVLRELGYQPTNCTRESASVSRGIYVGVRGVDVITAINAGSVRDLVLSRSQK